MEKFIKLAEQMGADEAEFFHQHSKIYEYLTLNDALHQKEFDVDDGYGVRVLKDGRVGFSFFSDEKNAGEAARLALRMSKFSERCDIEFPRRQRYARALSFDKKIERFDERDAKETLDAMLSKIEENAKPTECMLAHGTALVEIANSSGLRASDSHTLFSVYAQARAGNNIGHDSGASSFLAGVNVEKIGQHAGELARKMVGARLTKTRKTAVVFELCALQEMLFMMLAPAVNGERGRRGISFFCGKKGARVASESLTVCDDPLLPHGLGTRAFDGEGSASRKKFLIIKGVFSEFLYDLRTLALMRKNGAGNSKGCSPGNAARGGYTSLPRISPSNLVIGRGAIGDLVADCDEGLLVHSFMGEHTSNELTGDFSVQANIAFEVKNGEERGPVKAALISGNFFELIKNIAGIEKKQQSTGILISPRIAFSDVQVIGG